MQGNLYTKRQIWSLLLLFIDFFACSLQSLSYSICARHYSRPWAASGKPREKNPCGGYGEEVLKYCMLSPQGLKSL